MHGISSFYKIEIGKYINAKQCMSIITYIHACIHGWHISKHFVPFCIPQVLQEYKLMRQIDEDALHELNIKMRSFLDNVVEINHVHEEDKVIKI